MKQTIFVLINSLDIERGGLTKASLKQADTFIKLGYETHMVLFHFNGKYPYIINELRKNGTLNKNIIIHNMYNDLSHYDTLTAKYSKPKEVNIQGFLKDKVFDKREGHNAYRVYNNGLYTKYVAINSKLNTINFIDYFNEHRYRTKRETFDLQGDICRTTYMDFESNNPRQTIYYNKKGQAYLTRWFHPKTKNTIRTILFDSDGSIKKTYTKNHESLKVHWLTDLIVRHSDGQAIVISDTRSTDEVLINLKSKNAKKILRLHSSHLSNPYTLDSKISNHVEIGINNIKEFDAVLLLTEEQRQDIINRLGDSSNLTVIPHYHRNNSKLFSNVFSKKNTKQAVVISRLSTLKRIDHIVRAFKKVTDVLPDVSLDIYGKGDQSKIIRDLIKQLNLSDNVKLRGYTKHPDEIFKKGLFSILTSKQEGFALSVLESMTNKTPVISYDVRYGPNDMIINNETGILVENGNIDELAEQMIRLFNNPQEAIILGVNGERHVRSTFSEKIYQEKWKTLFGKLKND